VKNECGRLLCEGIKFAEVRQNLEVAFGRIKVETCQGLLKEAIRKEDFYWQADTCVDDLILEEEE
jgi:hypothetical protein